MDISSKIMVRLFNAVAALAVTYLIYILYNYIVLDTYFDHAEPDIAIMAWRLFSGEELYHTPGAAEQIFTAYGPVLYLITGLYLKLFGASLATSKLAAAGSCLIALCSFAYYTWHRFSANYFGIGVLAFVCYTLMISPVAIWIRPEPHTALLVTLAVVSTLLYDSGRVWLMAIVIAALAGLAVNLKIHSAIYFVPLVMRYCTVRWFTMWPIMAGVSVIFFFLPFSLPTISLSNYIAGLMDMMTSREIQIVALLSALKWSQLFLAPGVILLFATITNRKGIKREDVIYFFVYLLCVVVTFYPSSVPGSTWRQMLPFFPITVDLFLRFLTALEVSKTRWLAGSIIVSLTVVILTVSPQRRLLKAYDSNAWGKDVSAELKMIADKYGDTSLQMGYGSSNQAGYSWTYSRPILAFAGHKVTMSSVTSMERNLVPRPSWPKKVDWIKSCKTDLWIVPKLNQATHLKHRTFGMTSLIKAGLTFHPDIISAFAENYEPREIYEYFQVWACRK